MIEIYGNTFSAPANKIRYVANAVGVEYTYNAVNLLKGEHKSAEFLKKNPVGKVPALVDDGFMLFESNAIARYLASKVKSPLYPTELQARALVDQWMEFSSHHVMNAVAKLMMNTHFYKMLGVEKDERSLQEGLQWLESYLAITETHLASNDFFVGGILTIADITFISAIDPIDVLDFDMSPYPCVIKLRDAIRQKPFYLECHTSFKASFDSING